MHLHWNCRFSSLLVASCSHHVYFQLLFSVSIRILLELWYERNFRQFFVNQKTLWPLDPFSFVTWLGTNKRSYFTYKVFPKASPHNDFWVNNMSKITSTDFFNRSNLRPLIGYRKSRKRCFEQRFFKQRWSNRVPNTFSRTERGSVIEYSRRKISGSWFVID